jgi:hypothetical protein
MRYAIYSCCSTGINNVLEPSRSPTVHIKSLQNSARLFYIFLGFFPHIKDRTILACTQDILHVDERDTSKILTTFRPGAVILDISDIESTIAKT